LHDERLNILCEVRSSIKSANKKKPETFQKSAVYKQVAQERAERKRKEINKRNELVKLAERKYEYGQYVNDYFRPKLQDNVDPD